MRPATNKRRDKYVKNEIFCFARASPIAALLKLSLLQTSCPIITAAMFSTVKKMQEYLPKEAYKAVTDAIEKGHSHQREMADLIANGMKKLGKIPERYPLHPLVPTSDGRYSRKA